MALSMAGKPEAAGTVITRDRPAGWSLGQTAQGQESRTEVIDTVTENAASP